VQDSILHPNNSKALCFKMLQRYKSTEHRSEKMFDDRTQPWCSSLFHISVCFAWICMALCFFAF